MAMVAHGVKRYANLKHLEYVRSLPCILCGNDYGVEAHHLLKPWRGSRGMSLKAGDDNVVPLCHNHHRKLHETGSEYKFFLNETGDENHGQFRARLLWLNSPYYKRTPR